MTRISALLALSLFFLSACKEEPRAATENMTAPAETCAASLVTPLIGEPKSALDGLGIPEPLRIMGPGIAMTMDHIPERTNIEIDKSDHIRRVWCG
ncbi:I78 family peptidase inhibitor [Celeribacter persicus]|uniref:Peptidase inhibitor I78 family protein n=1 Tax=Celeribacter persicus TaxID=1651082 RepID=A0A2T5HTG2_9RHOB|nr:I78 family peptidase inhibitor [Celeribacter persicus]PTQ74864.1 peptidase inhibitor I78 family protein [Celeribacter persicus]